MATKPHKSLTGSDLHEPKGIEVAAPGQVYVSDGLGSGSWVTVDIQSSWSTGDVKLTYKSTPDAGWLMMSDTTSIGNTGSGATFTGGGYHNLFVLLWNVIPSWAGLVKPSRGGSAESDWSAGKTMDLPKTLGRALAIAGAGAGLTPRALGELIGEEFHSLTAAENGPHDHIASGTTGTSNQSLRHTHRVPNTSISGAGQPGGESLSVTPVESETYPTDLTAHNHDFNVTTSSSGTGAGHNNMQPTSFINAMIRI